MEVDEDGSYFGSGAAAPPNRVSLIPFSPAATPSPRRLSSCFSEPVRPVPSALRQLAWVSLQGRLVGAPEATSARAIRGGLSREEAVAWELFSPLHRVLIVAVAAVAAAESKRSQKISQLQRSVDLRDQVLLSMQKKLDELCEQMYSVKDQPMNCGGKLSTVKDQFVADEMSEPKGAKICSCWHQILQLNPESGIAPLHRNLSNLTKDEIECGRDEMLKRTFFNMEEQEERRMSELSDFCSSVTSSVEIQLSTLAEEQDFYNLRKECEEKDATIQELVATAHASSIAGSKRIMELEDIIRRKNMVITKLKKDMVVQEQQVIQLTRLRRQSSAASNPDTIKLPLMANNLLYDMSSTSPSSSDSDSPVEHRERHSQGSVGHDIPQCAFVATQSLRQPSTKSLSSLHGSTERLPKQRSVSPLKENCMNHGADSMAVWKPHQFLTSSGDSKRTRRRTQQESKSTAPQKRWV